MAILQTNSQPEDEIISAKNNMITRVKAQGPWHQKATSLELKGASALPMPVKIATPESLIPCFDHIRKNGTFLPLPGEDQKFSLDEEPYHHTPYIEFEKGVIYRDRRVDLCKMVLGPTNIDGLLDSLESNEFIEHFLLGNNIIGPAGCRRISKFLQDYPERMDTWYLAGNCIDAVGFGLMASSWAKSSATNVWLKRNPLGPDSAQNVAMLIQNSKTLRTLDLDQTQIGDEGVASLFDILCGGDSATPITLRHLYLNAGGVGPKAAKSINRFLHSPRCQLESLYLSMNPLGDAGVILLTEALNRNTTLQRLMLGSVGMTGAGAEILFKSLAGHPNLMALDVGQAYATEDLKAHFNWIDDTAADAITDFILATPNLRLLDLSYSALSFQSLNKIMLRGVLNSNSLCALARSTIHKTSHLGHDEVKAVLAMKRIKPRIKERLDSNVFGHYPGMDLNDFHSDEIRWLKGPKEDLRKIDSVYRNRDAGLQRRGLKRLNKWWHSDDQTLDVVMNS
ncbi:RNI-like protein [Microthyrium microscopicum]|uniref:RNI-like protein n=1 Tax=Microthyrium microscopicum TaxID=703497 RepID=A0A6A6UEG3_9PEZI|nr:RNI-like protein [Microthyrium microscopicum]